MYDHTLINGPRCSSHSSLDLTFFHHLSFLRLVFSGFIFLHLWRKWSFPWHKIQSRQTLWIGSGQFLFQRQTFVRLTDLRDKSSRDEMVFKSKVSFHWFFCFCRFAGRRRARETFARKRQKKDGRHSGSESRKREMGREKQRESMNVRVCVNARKRESQG